MSTLIRQATIIAMDPAHGSTPFTGDILIEADASRRSVPTSARRRPTEKLADATGWSCPA
jgi:hypothetical protein